MTFDYPKNAWTDDGVAISDNLNIKSLQNRLEDDLEFLLDTLNSYNFRTQANVQQKVSMITDRILDSDLEDENRHYQLNLVLLRALLDLTDNSLPDSCLDIDYDIIKTFYDHYKEADNQEDGVLIDL